MAFMIFFCIPGIKGHIINKVMYIGWASPSLLLRKLQRKGLSLSPYTCISAFAHGTLQGRCILHPHKAQEKRHIMCYTALKNHFPLA